MKHQEDKGPKRFPADVHLSVSRSLWVPGSTLAQRCTLSSSPAGYGTECLVSGTRAKVVSASRTSLCM